MVLKERGFWPSSGSRLSYKKQKCFSCQTMTNCKLYVKKKQCKFFIKPIKYNDKYNKSHIYNESICRKKYY